MHKRNNRKHVWVCIGILIMVNTLCMFSFNLYNNENKVSVENERNIKDSALWGWLNITNSYINYSRYSIGEIVPIEGLLFHKYNPAKKYPNFRVELSIDGVVDSSYYNITDANGLFKIYNYTIPASMNVYSSHKIEAIVINPNDTVEYQNYAVIYARTNSSFNVAPIDPSTVYLTGETLTLNGNLNYENGSGIPGKLYNNYWYSSTSTYINAPSGSISTPSGGIIPINIPETSFSNITLKMNYSDIPRVNYSEIMIPNIRVFRDVDWVVNYPATGVQGSSYTITGELSSSDDSSLKIKNRYVYVLYNGTPLAESVVQTDADGKFSSPFTLPMAMGNGTHTLQIGLNNSVGKYINSSIHFITVSSPTATPTPPGLAGAPLPFAEFFAVFIPILIGVIAALGAYGYYFLKKQKEEAQVVSIPLEDKIKNLKILKDTGRLEESLSYLFNAIFMELVSAKYGREKKEFETIRDFAIVSVKELGLKATVVYPFMTKVESIIYNRPFKISDKEFYGACDIFSPVYFELTGHNFILNF